MNKRQLVVAWIMAIAISFIILAFGWEVELKKIVSANIPILLIGSLLIYTLRTRRNG